MSFLSVFDAVTPVINKVLDFIPDPQQKLQAQQALMKGLSDWDSQQSAVNAEEAKSNSIFVAGWRPFIGWICGAAMAYKFVIQPFLVFIIVACQIDFNIKLLPVMDWSEMSTVLLGMLGLGGMRTFEKMNGVK
jgi:hypothetical protein